MLSQLSPLFPPLPTSTKPTTSGNPTPYHVQGSCIYVLWLIPSPSFIQYPPSPWRAVSIFHVFMLCFYFVLIYFVHCSLCMSEITCYLFFIDWIILLSTVVPKSIYAVAKGTSSFFLLLSSVPLIPHCPDIPTQIGFHSIKLTIRGLSGKHPAIVNIMKMVYSTLM